MPYFRPEDALPNPGLTGDTSTTGLLPWSAPPTPTLPQYDWSAILDALGGPVGPAGVTPDWAALVRAFDPARWSRPAPSSPQGDVAVASDDDAGATPPSPSTRMAAPNDVDLPDADDPDQEAAPTARLAANVAAEGHATASTQPKALPSEQQARNVAAAREAMSHPEVQAFMQALATGESGGNYDILNGGRRFTGPQYPGRAAGAYQITHDRYNRLQGELGLPDFLYDSQNVMMAHQIVKCGADELLLKGDVDGAIGKLNKIWPSLPGGNKPNFHTKSFGDRYETALRQQQVLQQ